MRWSLLTEKAVCSDGVFTRTFSKKNVQPTARRLSRRCGDNWAGPISKTLIPIEDLLKREFYAEMYRIEGWSRRTLDKKIQSMLFERTALSHKQEKLAETELKALHDKDRCSSGKDS